LERNTKERSTVSGLELTAHESMFIIDGGVEARLPEGSGGPVLAGPEAIFIAGRVAADAATHLWMGADLEHGSLILAYTGTLTTPKLQVRITNVNGDELGVLDVDCHATCVEVYLSDLEEPDEICVIVGSWRRGSLRSRV
jgi:hypothetical protein